ncbi:MAG: hypothetical protein SHS37scaffold145_91 [Phage 71_18]|nr:MAG: hypothetical protein SHS37scaffold145_91 [Phage 71_18]
MQPTLPSTVAYVGNFAPSWSTENHVKLSLEEHGVLVVPFQESELHAGTDGGWLTLADRAAAAGADMLLWTRTWQHERPEEQDAALVAVRAAGIPSASYHLDLYVGLDREEQIGREAFWRTDVVCTADGALSDEEWASRFGVNHRWVRPGVLRAECVPGTPNARLYGADVAFVGSFGHYHAEWPYRQQLVTWLQRTYGRRFGRWPRGAGRRIHSQALNDLYASVKVVVGDSLCLGFDRPRYWSDRVYETVGRGGFLIHPRIEGLTDEFVDGEHLRLYTFGDYAELRGLIDYYVRHDDERQAIAAAGQAHVREHCSYTNRVADMLAHVAAVDLAAPRPERIVVQPPAQTSRRLPTGQLVNFREGTTDEVCFREVWDQAEYHGAEPYLQGAVVLDVGANVGAFTLWALANGARLVHAYEPEPGNRAMLEAHLAGKAAEVRPVAVGAEAGELWLAPGPGGVHGGGTHAAGDGEEGEPVPMISVNDVLRDAIAAGGGTVGVWKIDCEGGEYDIIGAAEPELLQAVRCIVMEYHGPGMPHLPHLKGAAQVGPLLAKLAEYGRLETMGRPSVGGTLTWRRYA